MLGKLSRITPVLYILPAIFYVTILTVYPFLYLFYISMFRWGLYAGSVAQFVGIQNFIDALDDPLFQRSVMLTLAYGIFVTVVQLCLGIGVALLLNRDSALAKGIRLTMILPLVMTPFLVFMQWKYLLTPGLGPVSYLFQLLTNNPHFSFFSQIPHVYLTFLAIDTWQWLPFVVIVALAGIDSLPREPLEAADVDGASGWAKFRYVILPLLRPTIIVIVLFRLVDSLKTFDSVYLLTGGGPGTATSFTSWLIFKTGLGIVQNIGLSSAYAVIFLIIVLAVSWSLMYVLYKTRK